MDAKTHPLVSLLRRRLEALHSLAHEIAAGQEACIALNLEKLSLCDQEKERLCGLVRTLDTEIVHCQTPSAPMAQPMSVVSEEPTGGPDVETAHTIQQLWRECEAACAMVVQRNKVYAEFLRRARFTLAVMRNVVAHCLGIYPHLLNQRRSF
jgi:hypothetical protein